MKLVPEILRNTRCSCLEQLYMQRQPDVLSFQLGLIEIAGPVRDCGRQP
jgi:hypothetical protein